MPVFSMGMLQVNRFRRGHGRDRLGILHQFVLFMAGPPHTHGCISPTSLINNRLASKEKKSSNIKTALK